MTSGNIAPLLNLVGFITGTALYAMLLAMVLRAPTAAHSAQGAYPASSLRRDILPLATALLGLFWNLCELAAFSIRDLYAGEPSAFLGAAAHSALGLLPAVVVQSVIRSGQSGSESNLRKLVIVFAYSVSGLAILLNFYSAIVAGTSPSRMALLILTSSFGALIAPLILLTRRQPGWSRTWWVIALAVFAISALHLSHHDGQNYSWMVELIGHHASLPLAVAILYQDYKFALADIFLKRALTLIALVSIAFVLYVTVVAPLLSSSEDATSDPRAVAALLGMWIATALLYPTLRQSVNRFVDKVILQRVDYRRFRAEVAQAVASLETPEAMLDEVSRRLKAALTARKAFWLKLNTVEPDSHYADIPGVNATIVIPTTESPHYAIIVGELSGGRRLLSDDTAMLETIAVTVARRIDALRITHERCEQSLREQEISKLATEAELRALRAQINPHFLFNALTTIGYLIQTAPDRALATLMRLTGLLRSVLRSAGEFSTIGEEIELIESYLDIERARFEDRLRVTIDVLSDLRSIRIPSLIIQPLVENAIKHGIAPRKSGGEVRVSARLERSLSDETDSFDIIHITVRDTGAGASQIELAHGRRRGVGINNVEQRLKSYFDSRASLIIESQPGAGTKVEIRLPATSTETSMNINAAERRPA